MTPNDPQELDTPLPELRNFDADVSPQFLHRVHNKIERRRTTGQLVTFFWQLPQTLFTELASFLSTPTGKQK